jgi:hypothetical protein
MYSVRPGDFLQYPFMSRPSFGVTRPEYAAHSAEDSDVAFRADRIPSETCLKI